MNLEALKKERDSHKKNLKTFIILEALSVGLLLLLTTIFIVLLVVLILTMENAEQALPLTEGQFAGLFIFLYFSYMYAIVILASASEVFIPFIIINAVKLANKNSLIKKIESEPVEVI